jgi:hypothetical protein
MWMSIDLGLDWKRRRASCSFFPAAAFTEKGIVWGAGTYLARMRPDRLGVPSLNIEADHARAIALVAWWRARRRRI